MIEVERHHLQRGSNIALNANKGWQGIDPLFETWSTGTRSIHLNAGTAGVLHDTSKGQLTTGQRFVYISANASIRFSLLLVEPGIPPTW